MTENIEGVFNEYWREKIIESSRRGKDGKARSGKVVGAGYTPYGYAYADGHLTIVESEAAVVRQIYQWYLVGDDNRRPMGIFAIAEKLSAMGLPTPGEKLNRPRKRQRGMWGRNAVYYIVTNETYCGTWRWARTSETVAGVASAPSAKLSPSVCPLSLTA